ncbi:MAG: succinate dehydrogenase cytochrome b subunit [Acidimicrobiia bacterium]|nr:succinate dehydrogenase cytochrome b subunit [Acidimicrobiia bacterium]
MKPPTRRPLPWPVEFYRSAVGKKWVMALTGIALLGYVLAHMVGNLKVYLSPEEINSYGEALRDLGGHLVPRTSLLWILRVGLAAAFVLHVHAAATLTLTNRRARPVRYQSHRDYVAANFASRTMRMTGIVVALFVIFHLMDLTWGTTHPDFVRGDVYHNIVESFSRWPVALAYIVANLALGLHIFHGAWSMFQSLGINNPRYNHLRRWFAAAFAAVIVVGNVSFPVMVLAGVVE